MLKNLFLLLLFPLLSFAQPFPQKPSNYITDETGVLDQEQLSALNKKCGDFESASTNQIFVYIAGSLKGQDLEQVSQDIFTKWEIGQAGKDNGVLIAVFVDDHKFRIHTGYGLEGDLPDLLTKKIQDETMRSYFKKGDYYTGLSEGVDQLIYYTGHKYVAEEESNFGLILGIVIFVVVCYGMNGLFLWAIRSAIKDNEKRSDKAKKIGRTLVNVFFYIPFAGAFLMMFVAMFFAKFGGGGGRSSRSSGGGFSSRSSFGGGGGGRSGGGGSSSSW
jgi:uncharacterized protein